MAYFLKGIGDRNLGKNEILPQFDARIMYFLIGSQNGIISGELNNFSYISIARGVQIRSGFMQAYGYFAMSDTDVQFNFIMPTTQTQYVQVYAEIDLSRVPHNFEIECTAASNSSSFTPQQDNLRSNPNGKYQEWLYTVYLYTNNTLGFVDKRSYIYKPKDAINAENYTSTGGIATKFTSVDSDITSKYNSAVSIANSKLPKLTLVLSDKSYTITTAGVGSQTYTLNSGTTVSAGDLLLVNARITNYGNRTLCGIVRMASGVGGWVTLSDGGNGMPYSCIDVMGVNITLGSSTSQLNCGGYCRTRIRGDSYDSSGHNISLGDAAYYIDSIYKINLS